MTSFFNKRLQVMVVMKTDLPISEKVQILLRLRGSNLTKAAERLDVHHSYISHVLAGTKKNEKIAKYINNLVNKNILPTK